MNPKWQDVFYQVAPVVAAMALDFWPNEWPTWTKVALFVAVVVFLVLVAARQGAFQFTESKRAANPEEAPLRGTLQRTKWKRLVGTVWVVTVIVVLFGALRLMPPLLWNGLGQGLRWFGWLSVGLVPLFVALWIQRARLGRVAHVDLLTYINSLQYALAIMIAVGALVAWGANWRSVRGTPDATDSVLLVYDLAEVRSAKEIRALCNDGRLASAKIGLTCEDGGLAAFQGVKHPEDRIDQYRQLLGHQLAVWVAPDGEATRAAGDTAPRGLGGHARSVVLDERDSWSDLSAGILETMVLGKYVQGRAEDAVRLATIWQEDGLVPDWGALGRHPALVEGLVNASLDANDTQLLDRLTSAVAKGLVDNLEANAQRTSDLSSRVALWLTYSRWMAYLGLRADAEQALARLSQADPEWETELDRAPVIARLAAMVRGEVKLAECQSPSATDRSAACQAASRFFASLDQLGGGTLAAYGRGRATLLASVFESEPRSAVEERREARRFLTQAVQVRDAPCVRADAARWLAFSEALDGVTGVANRPAEPDTKCRFTAILDAPVAEDDGRLQFKVGLPASLRLGVEDPATAAGRDATLAPLVEVSAGIYSGTVGLPVSPVAGESYLYASEGGLPSIRLLSPWRLQVRRDGGPALAAWPLVFARPLQVDVSVFGPEQGGLQGGRAITVTEASEVTVRAALGAQPSVKGPLRILDDSAILGRVTVCIAGYDEEPCGDRTLDPDQPGYFQARFQAGREPASQFVVKVADRQTGASLATSLPVSIFAVPEKIPTPPPEIVPIAVFKGQVWLSMEGALGVRAGARSVPFDECTAGELLEQVEGLYHVQLARGAVIRGFIRPEQVESVQQFSPAAIPNLTVSTAPVAIRGPEGEAVYVEPECTLFEVLSKKADLWQVAIHRPDEEMPIVNYVEPSSVLKPVLLPAR